MKNLDELTLLFPEMEQKRQESTLGGDIYSGNYDGGGYYGGGYVLSEVTIYGTPITPPDQYSSPGFNTSGPNGDGSQGGNDGSNQSGQMTIQALHPETVDFLAGKFSYSLDPQYAAAEKENFKKILTEMDSGATGDKILAGIEAHYKQFPNELAPTITDKMPANGTESYNPKTKEIDMGIGLLNGADIASSVYTVSHELYHDYQNINGQSPLHSNLELDAYMFGTEVIKEMNTQGAFNLDYERQIEVKAPTSQQQIDFNNAWEKYLTGDYSSANYAILDKNFLDGSAFGSQYKTYNDGTGAKSVTNDPNTLPQFLKDLGFPQGMDNGSSPSPANPYQH